MKARVETSKRIRELRKKRKYSQSFVAKELSISQAAYSLIESAQNGIVAEHIIQLSKLYEVTTDYILTGEKRLIKMTPENGFVPFVKASAHASSVKHLEENYLYEDYDWYRIPGINPSKDQKLFEVEGDSMAPTILHGDVLLCQTHRNINKILDGSMVVIVSREKVLVKRLHIHKNPDYLIMENDNPAHEEKRKKIKKSDILEILIVRGKISSAVVPHHQLASKGKIKGIEENIEMLKKEMYTISKRLNRVLRK